MKTTIIIPARLHSTRLPNKLLLNQTGKSLIQHTYESAKSCQLANEIVVATDAIEIFDEVERFGGKVVMTSVDHKSGTDRIAEACRQTDAELILNVQGDEPEIDGRALDQLVQSMRKNEDAPIGTLATPIVESESWQNPNVVKVVLDHKNRALYFSRSAIPYVRNDSSKSAIQFKAGCHFQHIGVYAYRREYLERIPELKRPSMEKLESLEQLRFLYYGWSVLVQIVDHSPVGIDTEEDYSLFVNRQRNE